MDFNSDCSKVSGSSSDSEERELEQRLKAEREEGERFTGAVFLQSHDEYRNAVGRFCQDPSTANLETCYDTFGSFVNTRYKWGQHGMIAESERTMKPPTAEQKRLVARFNLPVEQIYDTVNDVYSWPKGRPDNADVIASWTFGSSLRGTARIDFGVELQVDSIIERFGLTGRLPITYKKDKEYQERFKTDPTLARERATPKQVETIASCLDRVLETQERLYLTKQERAANESESQGKSSRWSQVLHKLMPQDERLAAFHSLCTAVKEVVPRLPNMKDMCFSDGGPWAGSDADSRALFYHDDKEIATAARAGAKLVLEGIWNSHEKGLSRPSELQSDWFAPTTKKLQLARARWDSEAKRFKPLWHELKENEKHHVDPYKAEGDFERLYDLRHRGL